MSWRAVAKRQASVIARSQLVQCGLTRRQIERLLARGELIVRAPSIYQVGGCPETHDAALWVAVLSTGGALGYNTACHEWAMLPESTSPITVVVTEGSHVRAPEGVRIRRRSAGVTIVDRGGLAITTQADSLLDHLGVIPMGEARTLFDRGLQKGWITENDVIRRLGWPAWGNGRLRELAKVLGDGAAAESERLLHGLLRDAGLSGWRANFSVDAAGRRCVLDVAFPDVMLAIEIDGMAYHTDVDRFQNDRTRQNALTAAGWRVLRFTWWDLQQRPDYVIETIVRQLAVSCI